MPTNKISLKTSVTHTAQIPPKLIPLQQQAHDYVANLLSNYNFKKNKFYVGKQIEIAPAKDKVVSSFLGKAMYEFGSLNKATNCFHIWIKDKTLAGLFMKDNSNGDELLLRAVLSKATRKNKYPSVLFNVEQLYSGFMTYKQTYERKQVKRASGKIDKYFNVLYKWTDDSNYFKKFLNIIVLDTRVEWVKQHSNKGKLPKKFANGYPR